MSFRCQKCNTISSVPKKMITLIRDVEYPERTYLTRLGFVKDPGGTGWEIVKEISVCSDCYSIKIPDTKETTATEAPKHWTGTLGDLV